MNAPLPAETVAALFVQTSGGYFERAFLVVRCGRSTEGECRFGLWRQPAAGISWQWDGNHKAPTITPSINCHGCGRHFSITEGKVT